LGVGIGLDSCPKPPESLGPAPESRSDLVQLTLDRAVEGETIADAIPVVTVGKRMSTISKFLVESGESRDRATAKGSLGKLPHDGVSRCVCGDMPQNPFKPQAGNQGVSPE